MATVRDLTAPVSVCRAAPPVEPRRTGLALGQVAPDGEPCCNGVLRFVAN
jgi:hypothetical protein